MDKSVTKRKTLPGELRYVQYDHALEAQYLPAIRSLISKDLSEPYSIYVYRYFLYQWGHLCFMVSPPASPSPQATHLIVGTFKTSYRVKNRL